MAIVITNDKRLARREVIIKNTHRGLLYQDGVLVRVLDAGRHMLPARASVPFLRRARVEIVLVDVRERELTIKGQEILTSDKVAIRVSIVVQFRVTDPAAALERVAEFEDRLYSDVQLAARRSLASMTLEDILTNLQEIMNRVLATERLSQAQLVEARTKAETERIRTTAEVDALRQREQVAHVYTDNPALLRLRELETLHDLAQVANARIYIGFDKHARLDRNGDEADDG
jgi:regulator of protease activity HflC (stomatin/prohibitin superfamily)